MTDIIKRPTASAKDLRTAEYEHGRQMLEAKLGRVRPRVVIFTFKKTAEVLFGRFPGNGFVPGLELAQSQVVVMPGTYEVSESTRETLRVLSERLNQ